MSTNNLMEEVVKPELEERGIDFLLHPGYDHLISVPHLFDQRLMAMTLTMVTAWERSQSVNVVGTVGGIADNRELEVCRLAEALTDAYDAHTWTVWGSQLVMESRVQLAGVAQPRRQFISMFAFYTELLDKTWKRLVKMNRRKWRRTRLEEEIAELLNSLDDIKGTEL